MDAGAGRLGRHRALHSCTCPRVFVGVGVRACVRSSGPFSRANHAPALATRMSPVGRRSVVSQRPTISATAQPREVRVRIARRSAGDCPRYAAHAHAISKGAAAECVAEFKTSYAVATSLNLVLASRTQTSVPRSTLSARRRAAQRACGREGSPGIRVLVLVGVVFHR